MGSAARSEAEALFAWHWKLDLNFAAKRATLVYSNLFECHHGCPLFLTPLVLCAVLVFTDTVIGFMSYVCKA